jgi:MFS family permease
MSNPAMHDLSQLTRRLPLRVLVPLIVACALFMENLDATVLSTALPAIANDLHDDPIQLKLALTSYLLTLAVFIPASGWFADRFGARLIFRLAIIIFAVGSACCGLANSIGFLVAARALQGIGGAMMVPVGRLVILRTVPRSEIVGALAWLTIPALIGPVIGPPIGGFIATFFTWRWIFWINLPIAALGLVLATLFIPDIFGEEVSKFDFAGFLFSGLGLSALVSASAAPGRQPLGFGIVGNRIICLACAADRCAIIRPRASSLSDFSRWCRRWLTFSDRGGGRAVIVTSIITIRIRL